jgi:hypothetical protein
MRVGYKPYTGWLRRMCRDRLRQCYASDSFITVVQWNGSQALVAMRVLRDGVGELDGRRSD